MRLARAARKAAAAGNTRSSKCMSLIKEALHKLRADNASAGISFPGNGATQGRCANPGRQSPLRWEEIAVGLLTSDCQSVRQCNIPQRTQHDSITGPKIAIESRRSPTNSPRDG